MLFYWILTSVLVKQTNRKNKYETVERDFFKHTETLGLLMEVYTSIAFKNKIWYHSF